MVTTISLSEDTKARFDEQRPDDIDSAGEFVNLLLDVYDGEFEYETEALFERLQALEDVSGSNNIQREAFKKELEKLRGRIDDLQSQLPKDVVDELEAQR